MGEINNQRKMGSCTCDNCGITFKKPQSEINRNLKLNRRNFCNRSCSGVGNTKNFGDRLNNYDISKHSNNCKDEFTPFRYHFRNCKKRHKDFNIDLGYIKQIWEEQKGICPFSGVELILNGYNSISKDQRYSASLDRIDSKNPNYTPKNCRIVTWQFNNMRGAYSDEEFIRVAKKLESFKKKSTS
jgi:hypothetical protein